MSSGDYIFLKKEYRIQNLKIQSIIGVRQRLILMLSGVKMGRILSSKSIKNDGS